MLSHSKLNIEHVTLSRTKLKDEALKNLLKSTKKAPTKTLPRTFLVCRHPRKVEMRRQALGCGLGVVLTIC